MGTLSQASCSVTQLRYNIYQNLIMKIYKDVFTGDELFSDTYPMKLVDDCMYEVYGKHIVRKLGENVVLAGSNASAEEDDEGTEEATESGVDLILNHRLTETGFGKKADYMTYPKDYMKKVVKYLTDNNKTEQVEEFKKNINGVMKGLVEYKEVNGEEKPVVMFFKHGLEEEKC